MCVCIVNSSPPSSSPQILPYLACAPLVCTVCFQVLRGSHLVKMGLMPYHHSQYTAVHIWSIAKCHLLISKSCWRILKGTEKKREAGCLVL